MNKNVKFNLLKSALLVSALVGTGIAHADNDGDDVATNGVIPNCQFLQLVNNILPPAGSIANPTANTSVCVDVPVGLTKSKVLFNLDSTATAAGTKADKDWSVGLRHMYMLGTALQDRIAKNLIEPEKISVIGVLHGTAASWALSDAWWKARVDAAGNQLYPNGNPQKGMIENIFALQKAGVNLQLEVCGVTMYGNKWTNADLYTSPNGTIHVNQGAIGRIIDLEQHGYQYVQEGYVDGDQK